MTDIVSTDRLTAAKAIRFAVVLAIYVGAILAVRQSRGYLALINDVIAPVVLSAHVAVHGWYLFKPFASPVLYRRMIESNVITVIASLLLYDFGEQGWIVLTLLIGKVPLLEQSRGVLGLPVLGCLGIVWNLGMFGVCVVGWIRLARAGRSEWSAFTINHCARCGYPRTAKQRCTECGL